MVFVEEKMGDLRFFEEKIGGFWILEEKIGVFWGFEEKLGRGRGFRIFKNWGQIDLTPRSRKKLGAEKIF